MRWSWRAGRLGRTTRWFVALSALLLPCAPDRAAARGGVLDASFGEDGIVEPNFDSNAEANDVAIQSDGRIVVVGRTTPTVVAPGTMLILRYLPSGMPDPSFAGDGILTEEIRDFGGGAQAVAIQADGKIVVLGNDPIGEPDDQVFVARYNPDGSPDSTFADAGRFIYPGLTTEGLDLALDAQGRIVVAHFYFRFPENFTVSMRLFRLETDGSPDLSFGTGGETVLTFFPFDFGTSIAIRDDGAIVIASGVMPFSSPPTTTFLAARLLADGVIDPSFGVDGVSQALFGGAEAVAFQADGRLVLAGGYHFKLVGMRLDGGLDSSFADNGIFTGNIGDRANAIVALGDGRFVAAGGDPDFALARITSTGPLDPTFGTDGKTTTSFGVVPSRIEAIALQADGAIVAVGTVGHSGANRIVLARYIDTHVCGNGAVEDGEQCDDGNTAGDDSPAARAPNCCSAFCVLEADADADGICDVVDECPGGTPLASVRLVATGFEVPGCYDRLMLEGRLTLSSASEIDPVAMGLRLVLRDAGGAIVGDDVLPAGAYDEGTKTGWRTRARSTGVTWSFSRPKGGGGIVGRAVVRRSSASPGELRILVRARSACVGAPPASLPLGAAVVLNPSAPLDDQCGEARFAAGECSLGRHSRIMCEE